MELSNRLSAVAALVKEGSFIADIGTDHGYIPIFLMKEGRIRGAVAADINPGPLRRAQQHIADCGLEDRIEVRLSDGLKEIAPGKVDTMIAAGMGGGLMMRILDEGKETADSLKYCILQPQSEVRKVRKYLTLHGWLIESEDMVEEDHKFYPMMRALQGRTEDYSEYEYIYGKKLLQMRHPVLKKYLLREKKLQEEIICRLEVYGESRSAQKRLQQLRRSLKYTGQALECFR